MKLSGHSWSILGDYQQRRKASVGDGAGVAACLQEASTRAQQKAPPDFSGRAWGKALSGDLLLHGLSHTTIGAAAFHFRVRDGIGWVHSAMFAEQAVETAHGCASLAYGLGT